MIYKNTLDTPNKISGKNKKLFVIIHHTATAEGTINGVVRGFTTAPANPKDAKSCHYVIDTNGDVIKIGREEDVLYHAGVSQWGEYNNLNRLSIGIEIIGPLKDGGFTFAQRSKARELIQDIIFRNGIPKENILRHADLTQKNGNSTKKILWDWKGLSRKIDIAKTFLNDSSGKPKYKDWREYQLSFI